MNLDGLLAIISAVSTWIRFVKGNLARISVLSATLKELIIVFNIDSLKRCPLSACDEKHVAMKFQKWKDFIIGDSKAEYTEHPLDPYFLGRHLDIKEIAEGCELRVSLEKNAKFIVYLAAFRTRNGNFKYPRAEEVI